jgi:hypothetical protein
LARALARERGVSDCRKRTKSQTKPWVYLYMRG